MTPTLFAALVASAIVLGGAALLALIYLFWTARDSSRMQRRLMPERAQMAREDGLGGEILESIAERGRKIESALDSNSESGRLLIQAGWRAQGARTVYYAAQAVAPLLLAGLAFGAWMFGPEKLHRSAFLILMLAAALMLGLLLPRMVLRSVAEGRVRRIKGEIPMFIHLLVLLFEAGLSTRQAFASLVRDGRGVLPELGREFELVLRQLEAGGDSQEVLRTLAASIELEDLGSVLALLRQVDRYGGEVREPLLEALKVIEERRSLDMREMVNLMSGRMTVVMVAFFFPALLIFTGGPAFVSIIQALRSASG
ncbi:MAG: type secretion system family protein [Panacagrimonas sp.]|jgi:tight adherence protein C|nr:type II secretion system F family protein [Panacagrimonas sp.]MCC2655382.1 type secretion system family protein [Panacagrimonas sp.]